MKQKKRNSVRYTKPHGWLEITEIGRKYKKKKYLRKSIRNGVTRYYYSRPVGLYGPSSWSDRFKIGKRRGKLKSE